MEHYELVIRNIQLQQGQLRRKLHHLQGEQRQVALLEEMFHL